MSGNRGSFRRIASIAGLMLIGLVATADDKPAVKKEFAGFQGRWERKSSSAFGMDVKKLTILMRGGKDASKGGSTREDDALEVKDDVFTFGVPPGEKATAKLRPASRPAEIDLTDAKGRVWQGLYELSASELKMTFSDGDWRPTKIYPKAEYGTVTVHYKRVKTSKKQDDRKRP